MQNQPSCDAVLIRNIDIVSMSETQKSLILRSIDEETWNSLKHDFQSGATFPLSDLIVQGHANYNDFNEARRKYVEVDESSHDFQKAKSELHVSVPKVAYEAWSRCIADTARTKPGFYCWAESFDDTEVTASFYWNTPPLLKPPTVKVTSSSIRGGKSEDSGVPSGQALPRNFAFATNAHIIRTFTRAKGEPFSIQVTVGDAYSDSFVVPLPPAPPPAPRLKLVCYIYRLRGDPTYEFEMTGDDKLLCRRETERHSREDSINYSFEIRCVNEAGIIVSANGQNYDNQWPKGWIDPKGGG